MKKQMVSKKGVRAAASFYYKLMYLGSKTGCHQKRDRSFVLYGHQFPICARCTGVLAGYIMTIPLIAVLHMEYIHLMICCIIMFLDWFLQYKNIKESTNIRRFFTGILGGVGVFGIEILLLIDILKWFAIL